MRKFKVVAVSSLQVGWTGTVGVEVEAEVVVGTVEVGTV